MDQKMEQLRQLAAQIRIRTIRCMESAGGVHIGGAMSIADVLAVLYGKVMSYRASDPMWPDRDRLVVSKGHSGPAVYAALSLSGFFSEELLNTLNRGGTSLPSHCDRLKTPGIDMTTGSLGQGISCACGIAKALQTRNCASWVYVIMGDGELQEGQVWEAVQFAAHQRLDHLIIFVDNNKRQLDGTLEEICNPFDLEEKFRAFGCSCRKVNGYMVEEIDQAIAAEKEAAGRPGVIILDTYKGIGCDFAEKASFNHFMTITKEEADAAEIEILRRLKQGIVAKEEAYV